MAKHTYSLLCKSTSIDKATNQLSIFETLDDVSIVVPSNISVNGIQAIPMTAHLVSVWRRDKHDVAETSVGRILIKSPSDEDLGEIPLNIELKKHRLARIILTMTSLPLSKGPGMYFFCIQEKSHEESIWRTVAEIPLFFSMIAEEPLD